MLMFLYRDLRGLLLWAGAQYVNKIDLICINKASPLPEHKSTDFLYSFLFVNTWKFKAEMLLISWCPTQTV